MKIELIDKMGSDDLVVNAARVSYNKTAGNYTSEQNNSLIRYLAKNNHWSPFAHPQLSFRIKAPIFVARQLVKHQVGLTWNEVSARYVDLEKEFYYPLWRTEGGKHKTGGILKNQDIYENELNLVIDVCMEAYEFLLSKGVAKEQARIVLPLCSYTSWIWTGSLAAWARVYNLRTTDSVQKETKLLVQQLDEIISPLFPVSWRVLVDKET